MRYLTKDDLIVDSFERLIDESSGDHDAILEKTENRAIAWVKAYLHRYDTDSIFGIFIPGDDEEDEGNETEGEWIPPIRNGLLVDILSKIVLYRVFRRNAARKIPNDIKEDYDWAVKELEQIRKGAITLNDLPPALDEEGNALSHAIWGNNTNTDFYI